MGALPHSTFKVTFKEHFPLAVIDRIWQTDFVGLSAAHRKADPRVLYLIPTSQQYIELRTQLEALERLGTISFTEEAAD